MSRAVGRTLERIILTVSPGEVRSQLGETIQRTLNNHRRVFVIEQQRWMSDQQTQERSLDVVAAEGTPTLRKGRKAIIYAPARTPMQSGSAQTLEGGAPAWSIALEVDSKWANPLMGWTSTADRVETMMRQLKFPTKEAAIAYAEKRGMEYEVEEPAVRSKDRPRRFQGYGSNFDVRRLKGGKPIGGLRSELK